MKLRKVLTITLFVLTAAVVAAHYFMPQVQRITKPLTKPAADITEIRARLAPILLASLADQGLTLGAPVFMRIFKEERVFELWLQSGDTFQLYKTYEICNFSGDLGPKLQEGDRQSPEGFYFVGKSSLNPNSSYHLSFNLGFPNAYDRAQGRTGSYLMVHGDCVSIGCYAMTDPAIEEIYVIAEAALQAGQPFFRVHAFPFRMTPDRLAREKSNPWHAFWTNMKAGNDAFERDLIPPDILVTNGRYQVRTQ